MLKTVSSIANAIGALNYKGTWDANANSPALTSSVGTKGDYYVVGTAGSTTLDGISNWGIGDWAVFNGSVWQRVEGGANLNGVDLSVSGTSQLTGNATFSNNLVQGTAAKGVNFTANTPAAGMTSQLLNWYEEGTFTPLISDGTNNATNIPQVGGSYTRVGRLVTLTGTVATSSLGSVSGNIRLTGFPFATPTQFYAQSAGAVTGTSGLAILPGQSLSLLMDRTSAFAYIQISDATTGNSMMTATQWSADGGMTFSISYVVE